jgi:hypothetical protein
VATKKRRTHEEIVKEEADKLAQKREHRIESVHPDSMIDLLQALEEEIRLRVHENHGSSDEDRGYFKSLERRKIYKRLVEFLDDPTHQ